ncbi:unnamed protein product, partial [Rotaria sp. Silwood2]
MISNKQGWGHVISRTQIKVRQQAALIKSVRLG